MSDIPILRLRSGQHRRVRDGHLWIYRDELSSPLPSLEPGSLVRIETSYGYNLGLGFYHPTSTIAVRLLVWDGPVDTAFFATRLARALTLRQAYYGESTVYRLAFGESDFLPGLIIDRYGDFVSVQYLAAGMELRSQSIIEAIRRVLPSLKGIVAKNDSILREKEGLPRREEVLWGTVPEQVELLVGSVRMAVDILRGQKTGLYLDQRANYELVARFARGRRVLDCFTHQGGFALHCALHGATDVVGVDSSERAIARANVNAQRNDLADRCTFHVADVFEFLKACVGRGEQWDMVILDPPAFAKSKHHVASALRGYAEINRRALQLLGEGGILVTASCSHHVTESMLADVVVREARRAGCRVRMIARGMQSPCHPIYAPMPETSYLKLLIYEVVRFGLS